MTRAAGITVRPLTSQDWDAWWQLRLRALADHPDAFGSDYAEVVAEGEQAWRDRFETTRIDGVSRIFGAVAGDGSLVGVAGIVGNTRRKSRHRMDIWGVYVAPEERGTGTGHRLVEACLRHARETAGVLQVHITVASHNQVAVRLYERCGFHRYGRERRALMLPDGPVDEDLMVLMLDTPCDANKEDRR